MGITLELLGILYGYKRRAMVPVFIVLRNGKVDEVFDNEISAKNHKQNLLNRWSLTDIIVKEVKSI